jgi:UDP-N-acetylmuramate--alanine ligase
MKFSNINRIHFIGIGGIGMSALARFCLFNDKQVTGYDRVSTKLTKELEIEGAVINYSDTMDSISDYSAIDLVVYTPAIPADSNQLSFFKKSSTKMIKRAQFLGEITKDYFTIAIAGTHGKTTTSSIIAHILEESNHGGVAFLGGIASNYSSNVILNDKNNVAVVEADEFDKSFLKLYPDLIVLTSMDPDHLDIYGNQEAFKDNFIAFTDILKKEDSLIVHEGISEHFSTSKTYGEGTGNNLKISNVSIQEGAYQFDIIHGQHLIKGLKLNYPGRHNLTNTAAAIFVALEVGVSDLAIKKAVESFKGVKRRFEIHVHNKHHIYIDDYAHHPKEIDALISSVREFYPEKVVTGVFQPHLFSRTRDFMNEFCESLSKLDHVVLMDIYPAREKPIKGVTSSSMLKNISCQTKKVLPQGISLSSVIDMEKSQVVLTIGAGDIDLQVPKLKKFIANYSNND